MSEKQKSQVSFLNRVLEEQYPIETEKGPCNFKSLFAAFKNVINFKKHIPFNPTESNIFISHVIKCKKKKNQCDSSHPSLSIHRFHNLAGVL